MNVIGHGKLVIATGTILLCGCTKSPDLPKPGPEPGFTEYRFIVEITPSQSESFLAEVGETLFSRPVETEPLFPDVDPNDDPEGLSQILVLTTHLQDADRDLWDMSYALMDAGELVAVEPDMQDTLAGVSTRAGALIGCRDDGVSVPVDMAWALREVKAPQAWALSPNPGGKRYGEDVQICHIDTGWTHHVDLDSDRIDLGKAWNALDKSPNAEDPLGYSGSPGHGAATGSVIMSSGGVDSSGTTGPGLVTGVAPKATLVPIRAMKNVVHFLDSDVARAVRWAASAQCDVISMSLGGRAFFGLKRAIKDAVRRDLIVIAAAGNCVGFVVAPAMYKGTVAVAASNAESKPWKGTSHGSAVTISAPGEDIYRAKRNDQGDPNNTVEPSDGTSYAAAIVAGGAALWISHHNINALDGRTRQARFSEALVASAYQPAEWDSTEMGAGIIDLESLLKYEPTIPIAPTTDSVLSVSEDFLEQLARQTNISPDDIRAGLERLIGAIDFDDKLRQIGPELLYIAVTRPDVFRTSLNISGIIPDLATTSRARQNLTEYSSNTLSELLQN